MEKPESVEAYFESLSAGPCAALQKLRETIAATAPEAEEAMAWSMPAFKVGGRGLVGYAAFKDHYSLFPMSSRAVEAHRKELGALVTGKGTIAFAYGRALPVRLVRKIVKTRLAEVAAKPR